MSVLYLIIAISLGVGAAVACADYSRSRRYGLMIEFHYGDKPANEIIYYEMLSDVIQQMRHKIGDEALKIACNIPGLKINPKNGYIYHIAPEHSAKIISTLIAHYEKITEKPISFKVRNKKKHLN